MGIAEYLYTLIVEPDDIGPFSDGGFTLGLFIVLIGTLVGAFLYYVVIGRHTRKYAHLKSWLFTLTIVATVVFAFTFTICGFVVFQETRFTDINLDVWNFSILNSTLFTGIFFLGFSMILRSFGGNNRSVPFGSRK